MTRPDPHDEFARQLFEAARQEQPSANARRRAQLGVERDSGAIAIDLGAAPSARHAPTLRYAQAFGAAIALAAAAWLMLDARGPERRDTFAITPEPNSGGPRAHESPTRPVEPARAIPEPESEPAPEPAAQAPARAANAGRAAPPPHRARPASLAEEVAQLDRARGALNAGNARHALALIDEYERVMLGTRLRDEAELLQIEALALSGQRTRAAERARRFAIAHPSSPLADRARALSQFATETAIEGGRP
jgi:hypothetical protein